MKQLQQGKLFSRSFMIQFLDTPVSLWTDEKGCVWMPRKGIARTYIQNCKVIIKMDENCTYMVLIYTADQESQDQPHTI